MKQNLIIIACSIFRTELEHLKTEGKITVPIIYLNSMLHMYPKELQLLLDEKIKEYSSYKIVLVYGDCHANMVDYEKNAHIVRTPGINCCEIYMGTDTYKTVRKEGAFILLPEWAHRWKEVFVDYMGFKTSKQIQPFMRDMHRKLVYVDTGFKEKNVALLDEISEFLGLPLEIHNSSIQNLEKVLGELLNEGEA